MKQLLSILAFCTMTFTALASNMTPFTAEMEAIRHGAINIKAHGTLQLRNTGENQWHYRLSTSGRTLSLREEIWLSVVNDQILPSRYEFESKVLWIKTTKSLRFDHDRKRVTGRVEKERIDEAFTSPIYDAIGFQLALQQALARGEETITLNVLRHKRPDNMSFKVIGEEMLRLPQGQVYTWIIEQTEPVSRNERKLIWVAPELNFTPMRFGRYEDGDLKEEIKVLSLTLDGQPVDFNR
jgi:hypothetical protein